MADLAAPPDAGNDEDGNFDGKHAKHQCIGSEGGSCSAHNHGSDAHLPARDIRISKSTYWNTFFSPKSLSNQKSFFSTDVVKYQNQNQTPSQDTQEQYSHFSELAMYRWLQVALPLTAVTLVLGWLGYRWAERKQHKKLHFYKIEVNSESDA